jgi:CxxC motif-containing protein (DUF1111 family)
MHPTAPHRTRLGTLAPKVDPMRRSSRRSTYVFACALLTMAACHGHPLNPGRDAAGGAGAPGDAGAADLPNASGVDATIGTGEDADAMLEAGGDAATSTPDADASGGDAGAEADADFVLRRLCISDLPPSYVNVCSGCHTLRDVPNPRYPDLYAFKGTEADFLKAVRVGGVGVAGIPASIISDADIVAIRRFFTQTQRRGWEVVELGPVAPLFTAADAKNLPIVFKRADGAIVTRGAGRYRGRHEKEGSFGLYPENTFFDGGYGIAFEDFTPIGQQHLRVTFLPGYVPMTTGNLQTNFRHWKAQGDNATFLLNDYMMTVPAATTPTTAPFGAVQQFDETHAPGIRSIALGENYELEFGARITGNQPRRDTYYTDTFRYRIGLGGLTPENRDFAQLAGPLLPAQLGGDTTISWLRDEPWMYFDQVALDVQHENIQQFLDGRRLFYTDFTTGAHLEAGNTPFVEQANKAGPMFNAKSCEACHLHNGSGAWGGLDTPQRPMGAAAPLEIALPASGSLGAVLQSQEGTVAVTGTGTTTVMLADGTSVDLHRPRISVSANGADVTRFSARIARPLVGLGLLEAIDERTLLALSDPLDCDRDNVTGRPNFVKDPQSGALRVGRFGWKAEKVSVAHQVAVDAAEQLGVTTSLFPDAQGKAELSDADLASLTTYMRLIGVPPQRNGADAQVLIGAQTFQGVGCAECHRADLVTSPNHPFSELRAQGVRPFTDLLLHDMGPDLADDSGIPASADDAAPPSAAEWRTPPLWGVGLAKTVNPAATFLHDGRAADLQEAILWHGGEALRSKLAYAALSPTDRAALLAFLQSL